MGTLISHLRVQDLVEIVVLSFIFYKISVFVRGTRAANILKGTAVLVLAAVVAKAAGLYTIDRVLNYIFGFGAIALLIVFQPDLQRALARLGRMTSPASASRERRQLEDVVRAAVVCAERQMGFLVVIERKVGLGEYIATGRELDSDVSAEMILAIFQPPGPLHDGAVVISGDRIAAAACILPLADLPPSHPRLGTRHRAALGISTETDAVAVIVSEETGKIGVGIDGALRRGITANELRQVLQEGLASPGPVRRGIFARRAGRGAGAGAGAGGGAS